jgi:hypothetical protein
MAMLKAHPTQMAQMMTYSAYEVDANVIVVVIGLDSTSKNQEYGK